MTTSSAATPNRPAAAAPESAATHTDNPPTPAEAERLDAILAQLHVQTGHDFSHYKTSTLLRRIGRRMAVNKISTLAQYLDHLLTDPTEAPALQRECVIVVTEFFRDPEVFAALGRELIPQLLHHKTPGETVRAWSVGCATGEEAYSVAMLLSEAAAGLTAPPPIQVFATDIDEENLAFARRGLYAKTIATQVSAARLQRFFVEEKAGYRVKAELREKVLFAVHNLLRDPPFSNLDLICCRNLLIYFDRTAQEKSFERFHYALRPAGYLFLGTSESAESAATLFALVNQERDKRYHLYQRRPGSALAPRLSVLATTNAPKAELAALSSMGRATTPTAPTLQENYQAWTLRRYAPPRLLVNDAYEIVQIFNGAGRYLLAPDGVVTQQILDKIIPALRLELRAALDQAFGQGARSESHLLAVEINGEPALLQLAVGPLPQPDFPKELVEVLFIERKDELVNGTPALAAVPALAENELVTRLEAELQRTRARLQTVLDEHEHAQQLSRATTEALQLSNEELKSAGEELETSKEELQSMNEEMMTINGELKLKIEELSRANSDLFNLMASTNVGAIFLDPLLQVKRFTPRATELFHLIESDIGRPFAHTTHAIRAGALGTRPLELATQVCATGEQLEEVVQGENGNWYILRLFPYRTLDNLMDGVVVTLIDITDWQRAEHELQQRRQQQLVADLGRQALQGSTPAELLESATQQISALLEVDFAAVFAVQGSGDLLLQHGVGWQPGCLGQSVANAEINFPIWYTLRAGKPVLCGAGLAETDPHLIEQVRAVSNVDHAPLLVAHGIVSGVSVAISGRSQSYGVLGVYSSKTHHFTQYVVDFLQAVANLLAETLQRHEAEAQLHFQAHLLDAVEQAVIATDLKGQIIYWNRFAECLYGWSAAEAVGRSLVDFIPVGAEQAAVQLTQLQQGTSWSSEFVVQRRAGTTFPVLVTNSPIFDAAGVLCGIVTVLLDITERKATEEALRAHSQRLQLALDAGKMGTYTWHVVENTFVLDAQWAALFGQPPLPAPVASRPFLDQIHPDDLPRVVATLNDFVATGSTYQLEYRVNWPDGSQHWLTSRGLAIRNAAGIATRVEGLSWDITEHKQNEEQLAFSAYLLENIQDAVIAFDLDYRITAWSHGAALTYGYAASEALGRSVLDIVQPTIGAAQRSQRIAAMDNANAIRVETVHHRRDGTPVAIEAISVALSGKHEMTRGYLSINRDITERKATAEALQASEERFRTLANAMPQLVWTANAQGDVDYYNIRIDDYDPSVRLAAGGFDWSNFVHPDDLAPTFAAWQTAAVRGEPYTFEHRLHMADQSWRWHLSLAMPMRQEDQQVKWYGTATDIHARKQMEEALRASEAQLNAILYNIPASVYMLTTDHRYLMVNRIFEQENKITNAEIRGQSIYDRWPAAAAERLAANERQVLVTKSPIEVEEAVLRGEEMHYYATIKAPLLDAHDEPYAIIGISTDITARKRAEEALRQSEARYRTLFETMDEGFCIFEMLFDDEDKPIDYRFLEGNPAFARFTGLENAIGKTARELVPNLESHWFEIYGNVARSGEPTRFVQGSAAMGRWFEVYAFRFGGPESRQVALLFTNITERKQAEDQLRDQEELLRQIADNVPGLIGYMGIDERYRFVNATFEAWFCRPRHQIIDSTVFELIGADEHARLSDYRQRALAGELVSYETDFAYPDGVTRSVWGRYQPHFADDGSVLGFYLFVMDISERKVAEQALLQFNEQLEQQVKERTAELTKRLQELDQFAYVASHDLRAPLRAIDHLAQWIRDDAGDILAPASLDHLEKMRGRIMRMENLLSDLLAYSRADRYQYNIGKVDVALLIDEITRLVTPPQGFAVNITTEMPVFITYKVPLETVLRNLIQNAIKHHDRADGQVQVAVQDQGAFFEFSISDDGPGIPAKFHERIFQIFQTLKPRDQVEGSGMGLAIVKKAVEYYGGTVRVESNGQRGTTFAFTWPKEMPSG